MMKPRTKLRRRPRSAAATYGSSARRSESTARLTRIVATQQEWDRTHRNTSTEPASPARGCLQRPSSAHYLRARREQLEAEQRDFESAIEDEQRQIEERCLESIKESNRWCKMLGVLRRYVPLRPENNSSSGKLQIIIEDLLPRNHHTRVVSLELFLREHHKLETLVEAHRSQQEQVGAATTPIVSPSDGGRSGGGGGRGSTKYDGFGARTSNAHTRKHQEPKLRPVETRGEDPELFRALKGKKNADFTILRTPIRLEAALGEGMHRHSMRHARSLTRGQTQQQLRDTITATEELTETLEKQVKDMEKRGWNLESRLVD